MLSQQEGGETEGGETAVNREDWQLSLSPQGKTAKPKETLCRHVDALLHISEENFMKELEPYEYQGYSGWEDAVWGWTRVAPLSCLLMTKMNHRQPKHKEVENPSPLCVDSMGLKAYSSASRAEQHRESHIGLCKKSVLANKQKDSWGPTECPVLNIMQEDVTHFLLKEKTVERLFKNTPLRPCHPSSQHSVPENRHTKPQMHSHKSSNEVVTIKKPTLLPPLQPPQISPKSSCHVCRSKKALDGAKLEWKRAARWAGGDIVANQGPSIHSAALTPKYHACQHHPHLFSALSVSLPKKNQLLTSLPDTVHTTRYSLDKSISQAVVQPHMPPRCLF